MNLYDCIKYIAEEKGKSISDIERACNIANGSISKWNKSVPKADTLYKVSKYLEKPIELFLCDEQPSQEDIAINSENTFIYETPYSIRRIVNNKVGDKIDYNYIVEYEIHIHGKVFPQTVFLRPIEESKEIYDLIDAIFNGSEESKMYIDQAIATIKIGDRIIKTSSHLARIQSDEKNNCSYYCTFVPKGDGSKMTFNNLISKLKAKGIINPINISTEKEGWKNR